MLKRCLTVGLCLVMAPVAQAGVEVVLTPSTPNPHLPGDMVRVTVSLRQTPVDVDRELRMVQFDLNASDPALSIALPITHDLEFGTDIRFWSFRANLGCPGADPVFDSDACGKGHFIVDDLTMPIPSTNFLSVTYGSDMDLVQNGIRQLTLPGDGTEVVVGEMNVTLPMTTGTFTLDLVNVAGTGADTGAQVRWGFGGPGDMITAWRPPADLIGGTLDLISAVGGCAVTSWESMADHGGAGKLGIPLNDDDGSIGSITTEPRASGIRELVVTFDGPLDPASLASTNITFAGGKLVAGVCELQNLSAFTATPTLDPSDDTKLVITLSAELPDATRYNFIIGGIQCVGGAAPTGDLDRRVSALLGDVSGDRVVNVFDFSAARAFVGQAFDAANISNIRADIGNNGIVNVFDFSAARAGVGNSMAGTSCP